MEADDPELLRCYAERRDESAFTELVRRYLNLVYFAALRQVGGDAHRAEDVAQNVFTLLARKASSLTRHQSLAGWLHTTTRFAASEALRTERRRLARESEAHTMHELFNGSASDHEWERLRPVIDEALNDLGAADREAVLLRFFANLSFTDVGAKLNLSENTARMRVERALEKLHALLAKRGVTSTSSALAAVLANQAAAMAPAGLAASIAGSALSGAAAAAGAGSLAAVIAFMSASKITVSGAVALAITAAVYQTNQADAAAVTMANAGREHASLVARLAGLEASAKAAEQDLIDRAAALEQQRAARSAAASLPVPGIDDVNAKRADAFKNLTRNDPELQKLRQTQRQIQVTIANGPLLKRLGLTAEQTERAMDILARNRGMGAFRDEFGAAAAERLAQLQAELRVEKHERDLVNNLTRNLYYLDAPFTTQQAEQLRRMVAGAGPQAGLQQIGDENFANTYRRTRDWDRILAQTESVLSPPQMQGLRAMAALGRIDAQNAAAVSELPASKK
ncbi:MAG: sigma-70 family RNA polymerase sigma factor [Opitutus sp.]|nr:sigma-70 family RNA polymerase sigma factor [Opitutus sp.]